MLQSFHVLGMAIASNASSYDELLGLSLEDFPLNVEHASYSDMRGLCKQLGIFANGTKDEIESRLINYKEKTDARMITVD